MPGPLTLGQIVQRLGGRVAGDPQILVHQVASLEGAQAQHISFFTGSRYRAQLGATRAGAVVLGPEAENETGLPRIVAENPYAYFARVSQLFNPLVRQEPGVHASAVVAKSAQLGASVSIGAGCVVGEGAFIGEGSTLYPRVVVYAGCTIGARAIVHAGWLRDERIEELRDAGEVGVGMIRDDARPRRLGFGLRAEDHSAGAGRSELGAVAATGKEADVLGRGAFERSDLVHHRFGIAGDAAAEARDDLPQRQRPRHEITSPAACPDRAP